MAGKTKYRQEYDSIAEKACEKLSATDAQLADLFSVSEQTINKWKKDFPSFLESLKRGKDNADDDVKQSLCNRALGGVKVKEVRETYDKEDNLTSKVVIIKELPADTTAQIFWLKNRDPENWRDKPEGSSAENDIADALKEIADKLPS